MLAPKLSAAELRRRHRPAGRQYAASAFWRAAAWESDFTALPLMLGNASGGKGGAQAGPGQGTHPPCSRIGGRMGTKLDRISELSAIFTADIQ
ncbi:MAG: hypothetical protein LBU32_18475 [Clostridiales bacterium]|nr:hypothetical protein [Clostridiales bacterium]